MNHSDEAEPYIWLRYATQYVKDGRTQTVEMSIPVPLGADAETRERLFREAEAGMYHLINHVEPRIPQMLQHPQAAPSTAQSVIAPPTSKMVLPQRPTPTPQNPTGPVRKDIREPAATRNTSADLSATRSSVGNGLPSALSPTNAGSGSLSLPDFIKYIHDQLNLTPRDAMDILKVKSLSTGINLREALAQLKAHLSQELMVNPPVQQNRPPLPASPDANPDMSEEETIVLREDRPVYGSGFDEEVGPEDEEETSEDLEDFSLPDDFTTEQLESARGRISELREMQGAVLVNPKRLPALNNVVISQITEEQLIEMVQGVWRIAELKKLKMDQAEALLSWAKNEDDFVIQVEAVLAILEEERYARGNR